MSDEILGSLRELYSGRYWGLVGIETVSAERGLVVNRVTLQEHHLNYNQVSPRGCDLVRDRLCGLRCGAFDP